MGLEKVDPMPAVDNDSAHILMHINVGLFFCVAMLKVVSCIFNLDS